MQAVVIRRYGGPEVLELLDWPEPEVGPEDVLIRVHAVTVGRVLDVEVRARGADFNATLPRILGSDPAGVVERSARASRRLHRVTGSSARARCSAAAAITASPA